MNFAEFKAVDIDGNSRTLADPDAKGYLVVNVASRCGYTKQYAGLQTLHADLEARGLRIFAFPCNQFGRQEPGSSQEIKSFVQSKYAVSFPMFEKVDVNGEGRHPLFAWLTARETRPKGAGDVDWNFEKFLIDRSGQIVGRFPSSAAPEALRSELEALLE
ncbi:MAG: glutathione peroxidase [Myxococcota bacterium]